MTPSFSPRHAKKITRTYLKALAISIRTLSICTSRTTNSWARCMGATGGNSRFNRTDPLYAASAYHWSRSADAPDVVWPAVEPVQLTGLPELLLKMMVLMEALSVLNHVYLMFCTIKWLV